MTVRHLNCGSFRAYGLKLQGVIHCLLVETSDGLLLVDTGFGIQDYEEPTPLMRVFRALMHSDDPNEAAVRQLTRLGYDPADVRHIVLTHLHLDHAGGLPDFPRARAHVFAPEYAAAMHPRRPVEWFYVSAHWTHGPDWGVHRLEGDSWFDFEAVEVVPGLKPRVLLVPLTGHTRGHCAVAVETDDGWLLHYGDGGYPFYNAGKTYRLFGDPPLGLEHWFLGGNTPRLKQLYREHGDEVTLISSHDPTDFDKFRLAVEESSRQVVR
jgi:glyoxylase-like metal-dependent hydrolase (beta-lactamase superfamily II)